MTGGIGEGVHTARWGDVQSSRAGGGLEISFSTSPTSGDCRSSPSLSHTHTHLSHLSQRTRGLWPLWRAPRAIAGTGPANTSPTPPATGVRVCMRVCVISCLSSSLSAPPNAPTRRKHLLRPCGGPALQGYFAHEKKTPPRNLQQDHA